MDLVVEKPLQSKISNFIHIHIVEDNERRFPTKL